MEMLNTCENHMALGSDCVVVFEGPRSACPICTLIDKLKKEHEQKLADYEDEIKPLRENAKGHKQEIENLQSRITELQDSLTALSPDIPSDLSV
jgi:DNA repair exonuclease SbcCD ATPase subunit